MGIINGFDGDRYTQDLGRAVRQQIPITPERPFANDLPAVLGGFVGGGAGSTYRGKASLTMDEVLALRAAVDVYANEVVGDTVAGNKARDAVSKLIPFIEVTVEF